MINVESTINTAKRPYDDRISRVKKLLTELAEEGMYASAVELDGLRVEGLVHRDRPTTVTVNSETDTKTTATVERPRGYLARAREELLRSAQ